jgi:hypothetical protein
MVGIKSLLGIFLLLFYKSLYGQLLWTFAGLLRASGKEIPPIGEEIPPIGKEIPPIGEEIPPIGKEIPPIGEEIPPIGKEIRPIGEPFPPIGLPDGRQGTLRVNQSPPFLRGC